MSTFRTLVYKEWRDQRRLVIVAATMLVVGLIALESFFGNKHDEYTRIMGVWPGAVLLFLTALAADVTTRDCTTGTGDALARLPVGRLRIWSAKLAFLLASAAVWLVFLAACEVAVCFGEGRWPFVYPDGLPRPYRMTWSVALAAPLVAFALGTWIRRPLPAAVLAVGAFCVPFALWTWLGDGPVVAWLVVALEPWTPAGLGATIGVLFLVCSVVVFRPWTRVHGELRRWAAGCLTLLVTFGSVSGFAAVRAVRAIDAVPGGPHHSLWTDMSPDGRYLAVEVARQWHYRHREWDLPPTWNGRRSRCRWEVWILDREAKTWTTVDETPRRLRRGWTRGWRGGPWSDDGLLRTNTLSGPFGSDHVRREVIDPRSGEILRSEPVELDARSFDVDAGIDRWAEFVEGELTWTESGKRTGLRHEDVLALSPEPGVVFLARNGALVRHDLTTGAEIWLDDLPTQEKYYRRLEVSPDGRHLAWRVDYHMRILRAKDGTTVFECDEAHLSQWCRAPGQVALLNGRRWILVTDDGAHRLPTGHGHWYHPGDAEHLLRVTSWPGEVSGIELVDLDGNLVDVLYEPHVDTR